MSLFTLQLAGTSALALLAGSAEATPGRSIVLDGLAARHQRSVGMTAEVGAAWRLTQQFDVETNIHWMDLMRDDRLVRTDAGWVSGDPVALTLLLVWRGR